MKNILLALAAIAGVVVTSANANDIHEIISAKQLPAASQSFISTHFPADKVLQAIKETDGRKVEYEVTLEGNREVK